MDSPHVVARALPYTLFKRIINYGHGTHIRVSPVELTACTPLVSRRVQHLLSYDVSAHRRSDPKIDRKLDRKLDRYGAAGGMVPVRVGECPTLPVLCCLRSFFVWAQAVMGVAALTTVIAKNTTAKPAVRRRASKAPTVTVPLVAPALMTVDLAASYLTMSRSQLYKLLISGEIPSIVLGRKFRWVAQKSLDAWIERQTGGAS
jgi:excisionase family DNA binding protein